MAEVRRTLPGTLQARVSDDHTRPVYLVSIYFAPGTEYMSSGPQVVSGGNTYLEGAVRVGSLQWTPDGGQEGRIYLSNESNAAAALVLANSLDEVQVDVAKVYLDAAGTPSDPEILVRGYASGFELTADEAAVDVVTARHDTALVPSRFFSEEFGFTHLPPAGKVIYWNGDRYELEAD